MTGKAFELNEDDMMGDVDTSEASGTSSSSQKSEKTETSPNPELIEYPERAELEAKLTETEAKLTAAEDRALRALADMKNFQDRSERRIAEVQKYAVAKLLEELMPFVDGLEQGQNVKSDHEVVNSMREGMAMTLQMLLKTLEKFGVKEINPLNEIFNPVLHEVMTTQEKSDIPPNTIIAVMQKGYQLHDRLIRPARVIIAKAPA